MGREFEIGDAGDILSAIQDYRDMPNRFQYIGGPEYEQALKTWWDSKFPKGMQIYDYSSWCTPDIHVVNQGWANTSCGWQTIGGSAISHKYSIVIVNKSHKLVLVYWGNKLAYIAELDDKFTQDIKARAGYVMPGIRDCDKVYTILYKNKGH